MQEAGETGVSRWLNPGFLAVVFVLFMFFAAIGGSIRTGVATSTPSTVDMWRAFHEWPRVGLGKSAVIGTWRGDVRVPDGEPGPRHCGLRTLALVPTVRETFVRNAEEGTASGWEIPQAGAASVGLPGSGRAFCNAPDQLMGVMSERISAAWENTGNPRYFAEMEGTGVTIRGVYDSKTGQAHTWFVAGRDGGGPSGLEH